MSLTLHYHPLSSFCWKALVGLYELGIPFDKHLVDLSNDAARSAFFAIWPLGKFPVLRDDARGVTVPESSILLEHAERIAGGPRLLPSDPERALRCRLMDRLFDSYVHVPMQKIVGDRLRPEGKRDPFGVEQAGAQIEAGYGLLEGTVGDGPWALGADFTLADCAAFPALFYGNKVVPFEGRLPKLTAYFARLKARPSIARVLEEAEPYFKMFPG